MKWIHLPSFIITPFYIREHFSEALEQQLRSQSMPLIEETKQKQVKSYPPPPLPVNSNTKKLLHDDLQLSESSDED